jgi:hypothetical protein
VLDLIQEFLLRHELRLDIEDIKTLLIQGRFLLLLDGLNELPTAAGRELATFEQTYRQTAMIFTSRDVERSLGRIKTLEMQPLNELQMRQFVCTYLPESGEEMRRSRSSLIFIRKRSLLGFVIRNTRYINPASLTDYLDRNLISTSQRHSIFKVRLRFAIFPITEPAF